MKKSLIIFSLILAACSGKKQESLQSTCWSSNFYYYHNQYCFITDSTGQNRDGMLGIAMGDSTKFYADSIYMDDERHFTYTLKDTVLTIKIVNEYERTFYRKLDSGRVSYISLQEYTYGREQLFEGTKTSSDR